MKKLFIFLNLLMIMSVEAQDLYNSESFHKVHKSALKGNTLAQYEFALMFHYGVGVKQNSDLARLWFTRAGERGEGRAKSILYRFYEGRKMNKY